MTEMKKLLTSLALIATILVGLVSTAHAQSASELKLGLSRDFGYGGFNNDIQGLFTIMIVDAPADLTRVSFFIDSTNIGDVNQPPFSLQFNTDSYPLGLHTLSAIG
jgi:hypothetical protein